MDETTEAALYLAHLFLGQVLEDMNDIDTAISEYRAAVALQPRSQSGAMALSQGLALRGDVESARRLLEGVLVPAGQKRTADPYWSYVIATPGLAEGLFNDLRNQAAR